jgi:hypothetical protein
MDHTHLEAVQARLNRVTQSLADQRARLTRASRVTTLVGAVLCAVMAAYFYVGYQAMNDILTPTTLVSYAEQLVMNRLPQARQALEQQIKDSANPWAADLSRELQSKIPEGRTRSEKYLLDQIDQGLGQFEVLSAAQFRSFLVQNQAMLADGFTALKDPEQAPQFTLAVREVAEDNLSGDMRERADDALYTVVRLNHKLARLQKGEHLDPEESLERETLMLARRLELDRASAEPADGQPTRRGDQPLESAPQASRAADTPATEAGAAETPGKATEPKPGEEKTPPGSQP